MVTRRLSQLAFAVLALVSASFAQTVHTFSFGPFSPSNPTAPFTEIDGQPSNEAIGYAGLIQIRYNENPWWGMEAPEGPCGGEPVVCGWGFPNNGFLENNTVYPLGSNDPTVGAEGPLVWDIPGCGPTVFGCTGHTDTSISLVDYGAGVVYTVHDTYKVNPKLNRFHHTPPQYPGDYHPVINETGGTGTAVYNPQ